MVRIKGLVGFSATVKGQLTWDQIKAAASLRSRSVTQTHMSIDQALGQARSEKVGTFVYPNEH